MTLSRRDFLAASATTAAGLAASQVPEALAGSLLERPGAPNRPIAIASGNGLRGVKVARDAMVAGTDPLDAAIAGVNIQELDPEDMSVGLGGLPNEDGIVQLDASVMHGPTRRAGAVAALEGIATPSRVAKLVMEHTDHILLVGEGAKRFALRMGFEEQNLVTDKSRRFWLRWKARQRSNSNWLFEEDSASRSSGLGPAERRELERFVAMNHNDSWVDADGIPHTTGTINLNAVNGRGDIGSVTTTSGLSWKLPGRVGDSPILGAGQYCDNDVGAAGSTGRGEANMKVCGAFLAVEFMRQGIAPEEALLRVMRRVIAMTEARLLDDRGRPRFQLSYYAVTKDGRFAGACCYEGAEFAVCDAQGARLVKSAFLYKDSERPREPLSGGR